MPGGVADVSLPKSNHLSVFGLVKTKVKSQLGPHAHFREQSSEAEG